jgi:hypothetical protein
LISTDLALGKKLPAYLTSCLPNTLRPERKNTLATVSPCSTFDRWPFHSCPSICDSYHSEISSRRHKPSKAETLLKDRSCLAGTPIRIMLINSYSEISISGSIEASHLIWSSNYGTRPLIYCTSVPTTMHRTDSKTHHGEFNESYSVR